jgi:hypothetical protein
VFRRDRRPCRSIPWILGWLGMKGIALTLDTTKPGGSLASNLLCHCVEFAVIAAEVDYAIGNRGG